MRFILSPENGLIFGGHIAVLIDACIENTVLHLSFLIIFSHKLLLIYVP